MSRPTGEPNQTPVSMSRRLTIDPSPTAAAAARFRAAVTLDGDKPDGKTAFSDLGSPVSPLRPRLSSSTIGAGGASTTHTTSSSSSSSGSVSGRAALPAVSAAGSRKSDGSGAGRKSHSGELSGSSESSPTAADSRHYKPAHRRSGSGPLIYSGGGGTAGGGVTSSASSPAANVLPAGNICPSGKIRKTGLMAKPAGRSDVLGHGTGHYGHGSIMRGGTSGNAGGGTSDNAGGGGAARADGGMGNLGDSRRGLGSSDPQELTRAGNEHYKRGQYEDALRFYDRAVAMFPGNGSCRSNRAAALIGLGRFGDALKECEEAIRLDPTNGRAHHRLACLNLRLGLVEAARRHLFLMGQQPDGVELQKLQSIERHLTKCGDARKIGDWKTTLREADAAILAGADSSLLLAALKAESLLRLHLLDEADSILLSSSKFQYASTSSTTTMFLGMLADSYIYIVRAQVDMAMGRFDNAVSAAEKARQIDPRNTEIMMVLDNVKSVARSRVQGNELYKSGNYAEACTAYAEGLMCDPSNPVLLCNRAACRSNLGQLEKSIVDCNEALRIQPSYTKALLRRADSYYKLERWAEAVRDYEVLRKELPGETKVAEAFFHAQLALKSSRGEEVFNMKFGGEVEEVTSLVQFQAAISLPGASVVCFMTASNQQCNKLSPFVDALCTQFPSANFLKVDIIRSPIIAKNENIRIVPTIKIYKNGARVKEMICPSQQVLEYSVRHYSL